MRVGGVANQLECQLEIPVTVSGLSHDAKDASELSTLPPHVLNYETNTYSNKMQLEHRVS